MQTRYSHTHRFCILLILIYIHFIDAQDSIQWGPCTSERLQKARAQCGLLDVPLDYSNPTGKKIQIALSRILHNCTDDQYQGILLMNPGGPGGSGLTMITRKKSLNSTVADTYDWIGFDPRGVGESKPALSCIANSSAGPRPDFVAQNSREERYWEQSARAYANACGRKHGDMLPFMRSTDAVRDMDSIRKAFGQRKINFIGYSYGTYLGQLYATLFPTRVRRMILDAIVDPRYVWFESNMRQNIAFDRNYNLWFEWLAKNDDVYRLGRSRSEVAEKWNNVTQSLMKNPIEGIIGPADWIETFGTVGYAARTWPMFGSAFSKWYNDRNAEPISSLHNGVVDVTSDNSHAVYVAVLARDARWPKQWSTWDQRQWWSHVIAPLTTWGNARFNWPCLYWPVKSDRRVRVIGKKYHKILLVGAGLDAATPIPGAFEVRKRFSGSSLVLVQDDPTHGTSLSGNKCVDNNVEEYLGSGKLPERRPGDSADVLCSPPAEPVAALQKYSPEYVANFIESLLEIK